MWVHDMNVDVTVLAVVWLRGDLHEKSAGTDTAPINPLQQSISALNNICKHEIRVLQSLTRILEWTSALCSTHTYLCFTDRSHTSQDTLAAIIHVYVCEYRGFREEGKPKMEKTRGCHCNLPLWEKSEIGLCRGSTTPFP